MSSGKNAVSVSLCLIVAGAFLHNYFLLDAQKKKKKKEKEKKEKKKKKKEKKKK